MELAFVFDGQGAQAPGMGKALYEVYPAFAQALEEMDPTGRYRALCFEGTEEQLADTRNTQPCMVAVELAIVALLRDAGIEPSLAFGLSLGEYAALASAGVFAPAQAVELAAFRGQAMAGAAEGVVCGMAAVMGLDAAGVQEACEQAADAGYVVPTNFNCPGQIVISGETAAVEAASAKALELGAKKCIPLAVSGPFHTRYMAPAGEALAARFETEAFGEMRIPVLFNATAQPLQEGQSVPELLVRQVQNPIYFDDSVRWMLEKGICTVVEVGMGGSLSKFVKKTAKEAGVPCETFAVHDPDSFEKAKAALA